MSWFKLWYDSTHALDTRTQGWTVSGSETFAAPEADVEEITVPGRNGTVIIPRGRWNNVERTFSVFLPQFEAGLATLKTYALQCANGYFMLEDEQSDAAGVFYMARVKSIEVDSTGPYFGTGVVNVVFDCQPQRFLLDGAVWYLDGDTHSDPAISWANGATTTDVAVRQFTAYTNSVTANAAVRVSGYGDLYYMHYRPERPYMHIPKITIAEYPSSYGDLIIDAESRSMYFTNTNLTYINPLADYVTATDFSNDQSIFPVINVGGKISFGYASGAGTFTGISVLPRWWEL